MLKSLLGQGGMGVVWLAHDKRLRESVALKFLPPQIAFDPAALEDMRRETLRSRKLSHSNIVRIHDLHDEEGETPFISMEYVDGPNLHFLRANKPARVLTWKFLAPLLRQLCDALTYAHGEKVVHRDLKSANLMLDSSGRLKLADFGMARVIHDSLTRLTGQAHAGGTINFMSPQQADGRPPQVTDDIYSLGATLYDLFTSTPPFHTGDVAYQVRHTKPDDMRQRLLDLELVNEIPSDVSALVMACLAKNPEQRPQSAADILKWLDSAERRPGQTAPVPVAPMGSQAQSAAPPTPPPEPPQEHPPSEVKERLPLAWPEEPEAVSDAAPKHGLLWLLASALALVLAGVLAAWWFAEHWSHRTLPPTQPTSRPAPATATAPATTNVIVVEDEPRGFNGPSDGSVIFSNVAAARPSAPAWRPVPFLQDRHCFQADTHAVNALAFFPDRSALASVSDDGTVRVFDVTFDKLRWSQVAHDGTIKAVAVSANSRLLATAGTDGVIRLWKAASGVAITNLVGHRSSVETLAFSPKANFLASADDTGRVVLWDCEKSVALKEWNQHTGAVASVAFNKNGTVLATGGADTEVRLWSIPDGALRGVVKRRTDSKLKQALRSVAFSPNDNCLAIASRAQCIETYAPDGQGYIGGVYYRAPGFVPKSLAFTPDARLLFGAFDGNQLTVLTQDGGGKPVKARRVNIGADDDRICCVVVSPDGAAAVCGMTDGKIWIHPLEEIRLEEGLEPLFHKMPPDGFTAIFNDRDLVGWQGNPTIWSVQYGKLVGFQSQEIGQLDGPWNLTLRTQEAEDFELRFSFRLVSGRAGVFYRASKSRLGQFTGYQFDLLATNLGHVNFFSESSAMTLLARRGTRSVVSAAAGNGLEVSPGEELPGASGLAKTNQPGVWNDAVIIATGGKIEHYVNGQLVAQTTDNTSSRPRRGLLGLTLWGPGQVEFRDMQLKVPVRTEVVTTDTTSAVPPTPPSLPAAVQAVPLIPTGPFTKENGYTALYNGRDLSGWLGDMRVWSSERGEIVGRFAPLYFGPQWNEALLRQVGPLDNFELHATFCLVQGHADALYHARPSTNFFASGYAYVLDPTGVGWFIESVPSRKTPFAVRRVVPKLPIEYGQWHRLSVIVRTNHLFHALDGKLVAEAPDSPPLPRSEYIGWDVGYPASVIKIKDIFLKRLP